MDHVGHMRQVEHALLDINSVVPLSDGDQLNAATTASVCVWFLSVCPSVTFPYCVETADCRTMMF